MDFQTLKALATAEIEFRSGVGRAAHERWADSIRELRKAVPDWCETVLELIRENESLKAEIADLRQESRP